MEPMGKIAYEAWRQSLARSEAGKDVRTGTPEWNDLSPAEREAWEAAAQVITETWNPSEGE